MMDGMRLVISQHRRIYCIGKAMLKDGWTQSDVLCASARLAVTAKPYLQMISDILPKRPPWTH
jgi:hypothetical protein